MPAKRKKPNKEAAVGGGGIAAALQRQHDAPQELPLEVASVPDVLPDELVSEMAQAWATYAQGEGIASSEVAEARRRQTRLDAEAGLRRSARQRGVKADPAAPKRERSHTPASGEASEGGDDEGPAGGDGGLAGDGREDDLLVDLTQVDQQQGRAARNAQWEQRALDCVAQGCRLAQGPWMLPLAAQTQLVRILLNHALHKDPATSLGAFRALQLLLQHNPPARVLAEDGPGGGVRLVHHEGLWHPLQQEIRSTPLCDRLGWGFAMLQRLVCRQVDYAVGREPAVGPNDPPPRGALAARQQGEALLLKYIAALVQVDLAARLRVWRASPSSACAPALLQNSLLWRLLQSDIAASAWGALGEAERGTKAELVRSLLVLAAGEPAGGGGALAGPQGAGGGGGAAAAAAAAVVTGRDLAAVAGSLLRCLYALLGAAEEGGLFGSGGGRAMRDARNERGELDHAVVECLTGSNTAAPQLIPHAAKLRLFGLLAPRDATRLAALIAAGVYVRIGYVTEAEPCPHLASLATMAAERCRGAASFVQGDAAATVAYLTAHADWFATGFFNNQPEGLALAGTCLATAGLRLAAEGGGGAGPGEAEERSKATPPPAATPPPGGRRSGRRSATPMGAAAAAAEGEGRDPLACGLRYGGAAYRAELAQAARAWVAQLVAGKLGVRAAAMSTELAAAVAALELQLAAAS